MSDAAAPGSDGDDIARLLELCTDDAVSPAWLQVLRASHADIADATRGRPLVVEVSLRGRCHVRLGITASGRVVCPLGGHDPSDVRLDGEPGEVAAFLLGDLSLLQAQVRGLIDVDPEMPVDRLAYLRDVVGSKLRGLASGRLAVVALVSAAAWRVRRSAQWPMEIAAAAASKAAPAMLATVALLAGTGPGEVVRVTAATEGAARPSVDQRVAPPDGEYGRVQRSSASTMPRRSAPTAPPASPRAVPAAASVSATLQRDDSSFSATFEGETGDRARHYPAGVELQCNTSVRELACDALDFASRPVR